MRMRIINFIICSGILFGLSSCDKRNLQKQLERFSRSEVVIPAGMRQMMHGKDTILLNPAMDVAKLIIYTDSLDCSSCRITHLYEYEEILDYCDGIGDGLLPIFIFSPPQLKIKEVMQALEIAQFNYPVFIDSQSFFKASNDHLPQDNRFHTFLLDKNSNVVLAGDPIYNLPLWELYKQTISQLIKNGGTLPQ